MEHGIQLAGIGELTGKSPHRPSPHLSHELLHPKIQLHRSLGRLGDFIRQSHRKSRELRWPGIGWIIPPLRCRTDRHCPGHLESDLHRLLRRHPSALHRGECLNWLTARVKLEVSPAAGLRDRFGGAAPPWFLLRRHSELITCLSRVGFTC